jgi:hypothetical protein
MNTIPARYMFYVFLGVQLRLKWGKCKMPETPELMTACMTIHAFVADSLTVKNNLAFRG